MNYLESYIILLITCLLGYASWRDIKERTINNKVWLIMIFMGAPANVLLQLNYYQRWGIEVIYTTCFSIIASITIAFLLFYLNLFGGADAKALIALACAYPISVGKLYKIILIPITTFTNSVILSISAIFPILMWNIYLRVGRGIRLFEGYQAGTLTKMIVLFTSIKIRGKEVLMNKDKYIIIEKKHDGKKILKLRIKCTVVEEEEIVPEEMEEYVWATPTLPFIFFMLLGFLLAIMNIDLAMEIVKMIINLLI